MTIIKLYLYFLFWFFSLIRFPFLPQNLFIWQNKSMAKVLHCSQSVSSVTQLCPTFCNPMNHSMLGLPVYYQLPEFTHSCPSSRWCHPTISFSVVPLSSCPQSLPASQSSSMSQLFAWGGQSTGVSASASVISMNIQDWSPLGWTGWISLQSKGFSRVFSNTTVQSINFSALSFLHSPTLTSIHDHWKNHSIDQTDLCWQNNVSTFLYAF